MDRFHHLVDVLAGVGHLLGQGAAAGPLRQDALVRQFPMNEFRYAPRILGLFDESEERHILKS
jgi:hypothetical protein